MSHTNKINEIQSDDHNKYNLNDFDSANEIAASGTIETTAQTLHDHTIEENNTENEVNRTQTTTTNNTINATDRFYQIRKFSMAFYYGWQIICVLVFIFTAYEALQTVLPKAEKYPIPRRFFSSDSFVRDYPRGNLNALQSKVALTDLSFVMFYAPWSADSQHARPVLDHISNIFYREADFLAINCWQPDGECRQQYKKVMSWPVLMAYMKNNIAIPYNGQWTETALARFVYLMIKPIQRIATPDELLAILHNHDAAVVLFVNMETSSTFYKIFYQTAIKWLEKDPYGDMAFAVVTGQSMATFGIDSEPTLRLYLWNKTIEYEDEVWKASLIHKWIVQKHYQLTHWLSPPGSRSKEFYQFTRKGPVLLLFTPRNLYDFSSDAYAMIRQIAYEYHNCANDNWLKEMGRHYIYNQRQKNTQIYLHEAKECEKILDWRAVAANKCAPLERISFVGLGNSTSTHQHHNKMRKNLPSMAEYCEKMPESYETSSAYSQSDVPTSMIDSANDLRSSDSILNEWKSIHCKMSNLSRKLRSKTFQDAILDQAMNTSMFRFEKITGLACKFNRTLSFLSMDSLNYGLVAEKLGVPLKHAVQNTAAVIIDGQDESSYVLNEALTTTNLIDFVHNFTMKKLVRHLRHDNNAKHSHFFNATNSQNIENYQPTIDRRNISRKMETVSIAILSSENFTDVISDRHRSVAVLFSSSQCAFCTIFSSVLLTITRILNDADYLKFARIDSDKNDLPWQYTMETVPAFIIFNDKLDSRKYPLSLPVTVQNVMGFILSNLSKKNRLKAIASIVKYRRKQNQPIENSFAVLRRETENSIVDSLRAWRQNPRKRNYIFMRIQALRRLYFTLYGRADKCDSNKLDKLIAAVQTTWLHETIVR